MLDEEVALFGKMKPELLRDHKGKFALIKGAQFVGAYDSVEDAYWKGVNRFGQESFLVKKMIE